MVFTYGSFVAKSVPLVGSVWTVEIRVNYFHHDKTKRCLVRSQVVDSFVELGRLAATLISDFSGIRLRFYNAGLRAAREFSDA